MDNSWFKIKELTESVFMIQEPFRRLAPDYLTNTLNIFVIHDKKEVLVIDCGTGIYSIPDLITNILGTRIIITPFITHADFDHVGSLHEFESTLIHKEEIEKLRKEEDLESIRLDVMERHDPVIEELENPFKRKIFNGEPIHVNDGEWIQVGSLELQVIYLPGHTKGSIGLLYPDEKFFFVGDAFQTGYLYANHDPSRYYKTLEKLREFYGNYYLPGHEEILLQQKDLDEVIDLFKKMEQGQIEEMSLKNRYLDTNLVKGDKFSLLLPKK